MDRKIQQSKSPINSPDYRKIYTDMVEMKYFPKKDKCKALLNKPNLSVMEILEFERIILGGIASDQKGNGKFRAYDDETIIQILKYQKANKMTNIDTSLYFKISRNSIAKWKKMFPEI